MNTSNGITIIRRREAIALGLKTYFTGKPCPKGHISARYRNGGCITCVSNHAAQWKEKNPEKVREASRKYLPKVNKITKRRCNRAWDKRNPDKKRAICKRWAQNNPEKVKAMRKRHYDKKSTTAKIAVRIRNRIRETITYGWKSQKTEILIGCTFEALKIHLERQFTKEMTWDNYGIYWHVDHIRPCSSYDLTLESEQKACFNFTNLRPLEKLENIRKGNRITLLC